MLERTAGCLESGSLQRLFPSSRTSLKSRRSLQPAFWNHGAADIELSTSWAALLRGPDPVNRQRDSQHLQLNASGGVLLDFLYPAGNINSTRYDSRRGVDRADDRPGRVGLGRFGHRLYTSSAKNAFPNGVAGGIEGTEQAPNAVSNVQTVKEFMDLSEDHEYDEAWRQYRLLDAENQRRLQPSMVEYLATSKTVVDAERLVELFEGLHELHRQPKSFEYAIQSYLRLRNLSDAIQLHESALKEFRAPTGSRDLLVYMVDNALWPRALETWKVVKDLLDRSPVKYNIFNGLKNLPELMARASELIDYVDQRILSPDFSGDPNDDEILFASEMTQFAMFNGSFDLPHFMNLYYSLRRWSSDPPHLYQDAVRILLQKKEPHAALEVYQHSRMGPGVKLPCASMHSLLRIYCKHHDLTGMQQVLADFFRFYPGPTKYAYQISMTGFASMGDAVTVHALFEQFLNRFNFQLEASVMVPVLHVHAIRGELSEVIKNFDEIEAKLGVKPNIVCWNNLLNAYGKVNDLDGAFTCFELLLNSKDVQPTHYTFGTMMAICASNYELERTFELYQLAVSMKIETSCAMVDCLVLAHAQNEQLEQAEQICEEALTVELIGSRTRMWNNLLLPYAMRSDLVNFNRILQRMSDANVEYDEMTYSALMQALVMAQQPDRAYRILREVMRDAGVRPTSFHYAVAIGGFLAAGRYHEVFLVYKHMQQKKLRPSASHTLLIMKATLAEDAELLRNGRREQLSERAFRFFEEAMSSSDRQDIAISPRKGYGRLPVDVAHPTMFYGLIMFHLAQRQKHATCRELYERYLNLLPENKRQMPPMRVLSAFMISTYREGDFKGVDECWELAVSQAKLLASPVRQLPTTISQSNGVSKSSTNGPKIRHGLQLELSVMLNTYMRALDSQSRLNDLVKVVNGLLDDGFSLSNTNWNLYIRILAQRSRMKYAFELCESKLMPSWEGWARLTREVLPAFSFIPEWEYRAFKNNPRNLRLLYRTALSLAKCYRELQDISAESRSSQELLSSWELDFPKTLKAIRGLPHAEYNGIDSWALNRRSWEE